MSQNGTSTTSTEKNEVTLKHEETQGSVENENTSSKTITNTEAKETSDDRVAENVETDSFNIQTTSISHKTVYVCIFVK